jgi:hypothetical protein
MSFRYAMFKYQKTQTTTGKFEAGYSELFPNQIWRGHWYFADSWTSKQIICKTKFDKVNNAG